MKNSNALQAVKFALFSASAGVIQFGSFTLINEAAKRAFDTDLPYWPVYLIALILSILWNFTLNRRYTFRSAANIPIAWQRCSAFILYLPRCPHGWARWQKARE